MKFPGDDQSRSIIHGEEFIVVPARGLDTDIKGRSIGTRLVHGIRALLANTSQVLKRQPGESRRSGIYNITDFRRVLEPNIDPARSRFSLDPTIPLHMACELDRCFSDYDPDVTRTIDGVRLDLNPYTRDIPDLNLVSVNIIPVSQGQPIPIEKLSNGAQRKVPAVGVIPASKDGNQHYVVGFQSDEGSERVTVLSTDFYARTYSDVNALKEGKEPIAHLSSNESITFSDQEAGGFLLTVPHCVVQEGKDCYLRLPGSVVLDTARLPYREIRSGEPSQILPQAYLCEYFSRQLRKLGVDS